MRTPRVCFFCPAITIKQNCSIHTVRTIARKDFQLGLSKHTLQSVPNVKGVIILARFHFLSLLPGNSTLWNCIMLHKCIIKIQLISPFPGCDRAPERAPLRTLRTMLTLHHHMLDLFGPCLSSTGPFCERTHFNTSTFRICSANFPPQTNDECTLPHTTGPYV